jgi:DNA-directed RNA polymerase sigma subunit (sigma70/sigma32)
MKQGRDKYVAMHFADIAKEMGVTRQRVEQIYASAIRKVFKKLKQKKIDKRSFF